MLAVILRQGARVVFSELQIDLFVMAITSLEAVGGHAASRA